MTRRVIKPQPKMRLCYAFAGYCHGKWIYPGIDAWKCWGEEFRRPNNIEDDELARVWTPPCYTDDILYVRETWSEWTGGYLYKAWWEGIAQPGAFSEEKWHPSIHMPKEAARIFLRVTDVRAERLKEISASQAMDEGFTDWNDLVRGWNNIIPKKDLDKYGWDANPWVWVIEFERVEVEIKEREGYK